MTFVIFNETTDKELRDELRAMYKLLVEDSTKMFIWDVSPQLARKVRWELNLTRKISTVSARTDSTKTLIRMNSKYALQQGYKVANPKGDS